MGQTCICCKGNKVAYVLRKMEQSRAHEITQEDGCEVLYKLCMSRIDGQDRCRDFAKYDGVRIASDLLKNYKKKELVERAVLRLLRVAATNVHAAETMAKFHIRAKVEVLMDEEFDDDYIQEDGKLFLENYYDAMKRGGLDRMDDAEITEDIHVAIETMESHQEIREVQIKGMEFLHSHFQEVSQREDIVKYGGIGALIAVLEKHQSSEDLVRMTCDVIYHLAKHDAQAQSEFGKQNAIHWLAIIYRSVVEKPEADMLQLLLYTLMALVRDNPRNAHRWGNRRGAKLLQQTEANIRNALYTREVHVPFVLKKITEALPEPTTDAAEMGVPQERKWDDFSQHDKVLKEMQMVGKRQLAAPRTHLEREKQRILLEVRQETARKLEKERKRAIREQRRKALQDAREREEKEAREKAAQQAAQVIRVRALGGV